MHPVFRPQDQFHANNGIRTSRPRFANVAKEFVCVGYHIPLIVKAYRRIASGKLG